MEWSKLIINRRAGCGIVVNVLDATTLGSLAGDSVIVNSVDPGLCISNLARDVSEEMKQQLR